jgi:multisubunit Na+/H+ antiporter MnhG subunit
MKYVLIVISALLIFFGSIWFLQGINILPGSFMTGQTKWAIIGSISFVAGVALIFLSRKMRRKV